jgi:UPF0755 protein
VSRLLRVLLVLAAAVLTVLALGALWLDRQLNPPAHPGRMVDVSIPTGSSTARIGQILVQHGVVPSAFWFRLYVRLHARGAFDAGVYALPRTDSYADAARRLRGSELTQSLTVPEGFTVSQIAQRVGTLPGHSSAHFLTLADSGRIRSPYEPAASNNLEGLLFPDTYRVTVGESDNQILTQMIDRFDQVATRIGLSRAPGTVGVSAYQAVVVASLVEREAKLAPDRPLVAEVVYNRLAAGMRLQIDATVLYALGPGHSTVSSQDLKVQSAYNTYLVTGLPPGPIANPGLAALEAALNPAKGNYLYYVVVEPDGQEAFSPTLTGQEANIALARSRGLEG